MKILSLKKRPEFAAVAQTGRKVVTKLFIIQGSRQDPSQKEKFSNSPRFGLIVTKKNGNAVQRNLIKRRFRALIQDHIKHGTAAPLDYVLIARPGRTLEARFQDLETKLAEALETLKKFEEEKND